MERRERKNPIMHGSIEVRNRKQIALAKEEWFVEALKLDRKSFKARVRGLLRGSMIANAFTIYDRERRLHPITPPPANVQPF